MNLQYKLRILIYLFIRFGLIILIKEVIVMSMYVHYYSFSIKFLDVADFLKGNCIR